MREHGERERERQSIDDEIKKDSGAASFLTNHARPKPATTTSLFSLDALTHS